MPKTYTAVPSVSTGDVYTAASYNTYTATNVSNLIVPPMCRVKRTSNLTSYTSQALITWEAKDFDTDSMWSSGTSIAINTAGLYTITFHCRMTTATSPTLVESQIGGSVNDRLAVALSRANDYRFTHSTLSNLAVGATVAAAVEYSGGTSHAIDGTTLVTTLTVSWIGRTS